ncbi:MAG: GNAT family N-acetyltransferase [Bacteroidota bacterium]|nr:GNAT family N-acetyltransferase [Bacteroidota bacterium]
MEQLLDNPIYNALISGNADFSNGDDQSKYFSIDIDPFAGLRENSRHDLNNLYRISPAESFFILFIPGEIEIPYEWRVIDRMKILQMVYDKPVPPAGTGQEFVVLQEEHIPQMLALTKMTNPGPFLSGTIRFGNYRGIFSGSRLVSMAGQRLQPKPYTEISAVCTHPDHLGKGYAGMLIAEQISRIIAGSGIPFLHVREENENAIKLYHKLGFATRRGMIAYAIKKPVTKIS